MRDHELLRRKKIRLDPVCYASLGAVCSITIGVRGKRAVFAEGRAAAAAVRVIRELGRDLDVPVYGYCVMPDHVHLVVAASPRCDLVAFVARFKSLVTRALWGFGWKGAVWQRGFYDHFVRADEQLVRVAEYVVDNPVRAGLAARRGEYPYAGSMVYASV